MLDYHFLSHAEQMNSKSKEVVLMVAVILTGSSVFERSSEKNTETSDEI